MTTFSTSPDIPIERNGSAETLQRTSVASLSQDMRVETTEDEPNGPPGVRLTPEEDPPFSLAGRKTLRAELWIVLWLSIAASGLRSLLSLIDSLTRGVKLSSQSTTLITT